MVSTYDVFDDLSIYAPAHFEKFADVIDELALSREDLEAPTFAPIDTLPAPAECVMRKTFEELVEYSLNIPQFAELFTTATTWEESRAPILLSTANWNATAPTANCLTTGGISTRSTLSRRPRVSAMRV
jgi:hypothetical protein